MKALRSWWIALVTLSAPLLAAVPGQVIVDPANPVWFSYEGGGSFFLCAPGEPEGFLYRGSQNGDGTRDGDQQDLLDRLAPTGANGIYLMAVRSHGGDGDSTQNPFIDNDPDLGLNDAVLDQWEGWFDQTDAAGIVIFFIIYDDSARVWGQLGDGVQPEETPFINALVDRFEHHTHLIWVVAEEFQERWTPTEASDLAAIIRAADDHEHPIAVHQLGGLLFHFPDDPNVDQFAIQLSEPGTEAVHDLIVSAWEDSAGRYNLNLAEPHLWGTSDLARRNSWAVGTAGAYVMHFEWDFASAPLARLQECGYRRAFFEQADLTDMAPNDALALGVTDFVLAEPDQSYIAYSASAGQIGLAGLPSGSASLTWLDTVSGATTQESVSLLGGDQLFDRPAGFGNEVALLLTVGAAPPAEIFEDGFESGDTSNWSATVP